MEFKIKSWTDWQTGELKLVIYGEGPENRHGGYAVYNLFNHQTLALELGQKIPDEFMITLPWLIGGVLKKAFSEWVHDEGIRPDEVTKKEGSVEGSLQATRYHLEDLRRLLKLPAPQYQITVNDKGKEEIRP